jgi:hypothetical protein
MGSVDVIGNGYRNLIDAPASFSKVTFMHG